MYVGWMGDIGEDCGIILFLLVFGEGGVGLRGFFGVGWRRRECKIEFCFWNLGSSNVFCYKFGVVWL